MDTSGRTRGWVCCRKGTSPAHAPQQAPVPALGVNKITQKRTRQGFGRRLDLPPHHATRTGRFQLKLFVYGCLIKYATARHNHLPVQRAGVERCAIPTHQTPPSELTGEHIVASCQMFRGETALTIPIYIDTSAAILGAIREKLQKCTRRESSAGLTEVRTRQGR